MAFIERSRTDLPAALDRIEELEVALREALSEWEDALQYKLDFLVEKHGDRESLARLRAIHGGTEP